MCPVCLFLVVIEYFFLVGLPLSVKELGRMDTLIRRFHHSDIKLITNMGF